MVFYAIALQPGTTMTQQNSPLWEEGEVVECFLDPAGAGQRYYEFQVNPLGTLLALRFDRLGQPWRDAASWHADGVMSSATIVRNYDFGRGVGRSEPVQDGYIATLTIPFAALSDQLAQPPKAGDRWRANFYRYRRLPVDVGGIEYQAFSPTIQLNFHQPDKFGDLLFSE